MKPVAAIALGLFAAALLGVAYALWTPDLSRAELENKYLARPEDLRQVAGERLHVRDTGPRDAPALILLHGFSSSLHTYEPWAKLLEDRYRVVRLDLPGAGLTGPNAANEYSTPHAVAMVRALMDQLGLARATLIGNSMGGKIAWTFAAAHPERTERLVLISPDGFASPGAAYGQKIEVPGWLSIMTYVLPRFFVRPQLAAAYADKTRLTDATFERYYDLMLAPGVRKALIATMAQGVIEDPVPRLKTITAPTLLLWGNKDALIPFSNAADYMKALPNARLVAFSDLGHVPFEEAPEESVEPVRAFLGE